MRFYKFVTTILREFKRKDIKEIYDLILEFFHSLLIEVH
jgi:hypothetical protein